MNDIQRLLRKLLVRRAGRRKQREEITNILSDEFVWIDDEKIQVRRDLDKIEMFFYITCTFPNGTYFVFSKFNGTELKPISENSDKEIVNKLIDALNNLESSLKDNPGMTIV